jgi:hypothetical protein
MIFNQQFTVSWNTIWQNLSRRISQDVIKRVEFTSPFSEFVRQLELGNYQQQTHTDPAFNNTFLLDTVPNSAILNDFTDKVITTVHEVNVDLFIASTSKEYVARTSFSFWDNVSMFLNSLVANLRVTGEIHKNNIIKQMIYNAWSYGMVDTTLLAEDPSTSEDASNKYIIAINNMVDDMLTEPSKRFLTYNNQDGLADESKITARTTEIPYVILFNDYINSIEALSTIALAFGRYAGDSGQDVYRFSNRWIRLNRLDFPTSVPPTPRSSITSGSMIPITGVNFFEMPEDESGNPLYSGEPLAGDTPVAFVVDPQALVLQTQLEVQDTFLNPASRANSSYFLLRMIVSLDGSSKIGCIAIDSESGT